MLPRVEFEQWLSDEPDGSRREAVERWVMSLAETVGDLSSTLDVRHPDPSVPTLASLRASTARLDKECPANQEVASLLASPPLIRVPEKQRVPRQERRRPS